MKQKCSILVALMLLTSCAQNKEVLKEWVLVNTIQLDGVNPIGIAEMNDTLWLSDGDHNRLVQIDKEGKIQKTIDSLDRPMHIDANDEILYIPQYGMDNIATLKKQVLSEFVLKDSLDAPAGVSIFGDEMAIADFYNNRILYTNGSDWISFGKEGKAEGEFYYPTDVQITTDKIWVADAYNNRIQVFDKQGKFLQTMGKEQKMNAATGIYVTTTEVFVTDFENDRVLIFDIRGTLKQELKDQIEKPTDMIIIENTLNIINYRNGKLLAYELQPVAADKE